MSLTRIINGGWHFSKQPLHSELAAVAAEGESKQRVEFNGADGYTEREFTIEPVRGNQTVTFLFLPGCRFDFQWFQF